MRGNTKAVLFFFLMSFLACKQGKEVAQNQPEEMELSSSANEKDLAAVVLEFNKALINRDKAVLEQLCSDQLSYGHSSGLIQNKAQFIEDLLQGPFRFLSIATPEQTILLDGDTAVVRHILTADATRDGQPVDLKIGNVLVFRKEKESQWKLLARQAYKLP
jgi:ketosteroid isomerase-like protein